MTRVRVGAFPCPLALSVLRDGSTKVSVSSPTAYVPGLHGDHLEWLRHHVRLTLVCGQGMWEDTTGALNSTRTLAGLLAGKGIPHELDVWGYDVAHDWPWWRRQLPHHLHRMT